MKIFKRFLDFYIDCSIHVAFAVFSLLQITKLSLDIETEISLDYFIFFGTILGYNFLKYFEVFRRRTYTLKQNYLIIIFSIIAFLGMVYYYFQISISHKIAFLKIGIVVFAYPFLRNYGFWKMVIVSFCVTYITVYIPTLSKEINLNIFYFFQQFIIVLGLLIPLEIIDIEKDAKTIFTLPQKIGIKKTKFLGYLLLLIFLFLSFFSSRFIFKIDIITTTVIAFAIYFSNEKRSKYYTSFWVESIPILWWILMFVYLK